MPEPNKQIEVDYSFRVSQNFEGMVKFNNASVCVQNFEWRFGFFENNKEKKSNLPAPTIIFPSNGNYNVVLNAQDSTGKIYTVEKNVEVNNY
ncbi:MAG: PKD domain-containing protein [Fulvivirga sp.]